MPPMARIRLTSQDYGYSNQYTSYGAQGGAGGGGFFPGEGSQSSQTKREKVRYIRSLNHDTCLRADVGQWPGYATSRYYKAVD